MTWHCCATCDVIEMTREETYVCGDELRCRSCARAWLESRQDLDSYGLAERRTLSHVADAMRAAWARLDDLDEPAILYQSARRSARAATLEEWIDTLEDWAVCGGPAPPHHLNLPMPEMKND